MFALVVYNRKANPKSVILSSNKLFLANKSVDPETVSENEFCRLYQMPPRFRFQSEQNLESTAHGTFMTVNEYKEMLVRKRGRQIDLEALVPSV